MTMAAFVEGLAARIWNRRVAKRLSKPLTGGLQVGTIVTEDGNTTIPYFIPHAVRTHHTVILGRTGTGKSRLLTFFAQQDIQGDTAARNGRGFAFFDLHAQILPHLLALIAEEEQRKHQDLSERLIIVEPADPEYSVGLNLLESSPAQRFVQAAEISQVLKQRWHLDSFGARTEELLRNSILALADNGLSLVELPLLLTKGSFRAACLKRITNSEVRAYFEGRYDAATPAMQAVMRDPILNKITEMISDPRFRHIVGQTKSTFDLVDAMDSGARIILSIDKGRLGEQAATFGSLFLTKLKNALFARKNRSLFSIYCDEIQNLVTFDSGIDTLFSESRKFGAGICSANQYLDQHPAHIRSAVLSVGTHICFQLSGPDAERMAGLLDTGRGLVDRLRNLPQRHLIAKNGAYRPREVVVPTVMRPKVDFLDLYARSRRRWARKRSEIESEIARRQQAVVRGANSKEVLDAWE
jgi:hypothetical protein